MKRNELTAKSWSRTKVCGLAVIGLLACISVGYLALASFQTRTVIPQVQKPAVAHASDVKSTPDRLKLQADKQAEPLLALLRKSPDDPVLLAEIGKLYYQMRRFSVAAKYYEDSVSVKPDATILVKLGGAYHFAGDDDRAIDAWNHALRLDSNNPDALYNLGFVKWHSQGNPKAAIAAWQKLLKTNPNHPKRNEVEALLAQAKQHLKNPMARNE